MAADGAVATHAHRRAERRARHTGRLHAMSALCGGAMHSERRALRDGRPSTGAEPVCATMQRRRCPGHCCTSRRTSRTDRLIIVGAGHIAVPLAALGVLLDFRVTVLDDREEFATDERFADDVVVLRADFATDPFAGERIDGGCWIALVTRGHRWDFDCLRRLLETEAPALHRHDRQPAAGAGGVPRAAGGGHAAGAAGDDPRAHRAGAAGRRRRRRSPWRLRPR
jgi:xanthine/CO dehydrogenase XdhC/CoxF family maturation factor